MDYTSILSSPAPFQGIERMLGSLTSIESRLTQGAGKELSLRAHGIALEEAKKAQCGCRALCRDCREKTHQKRNPE